MNQSLFSNRTGYFRLTVYSFCFVLLLWQAVPGFTDEASEPALESLSLFPPKIDLRGTNNSHQLLVIGEYSNGLGRDLTTSVAFEISQPEIAVLDKTGQLHAKANGAFIVTAQSGDKTCQTEVTVSEFDQEKPFHFARDLGTILTRYGCNSTECHGSIKGRGGFKLSNNAFHPQEDYRWITEGGTFQVLTADAAGEKLPRIDRQDPAKSLLLLKPTESVPHEGGKHFTEDSAAYQTISEWIRRDAPFGTPAEADRVRIERIEVFPGKSFLAIDSELPLVVTAFLSAGGQEDISSQVRYETNQSDVITISQTGLVHAVGPGEAQVIVRAVGQATSFRIAVVEQPMLDYPDVPSTNLIDHFVFKKLRKLGIVPASLSSDEEFLRRICLDLTGTLPPPERVRQFLQDDAPDKRDKVIDILLDTPEYNDFWTFRFADFLRVEYNARQDVKNTHMYNEWIRSCITDNLPYDQLAHERIAAQGNAAATQNYFFLGFRKPHQIASEQARVFLGIRLDCAQCHDHPFETFSQNQYWELAAFFSQMTIVPQFGLGTSLIIDDPGVGASKGKTEHPRTKKQVLPKTLNGDELSPDYQNNPRGQLADWFTSPDNPYFASAIVNRMWGYFFGRGLVDPVDDFRTTNPATHPDLLAGLAEDFVDHGYDLKHLMRRIVRSRTYQLSSKKNSTNQSDEINYSRAFPRALEAEVLLDAICQVTHFEEVFSIEGHPVAPRGMLATAPRGTRAIDLVPELFPSQFLAMYGRHLRSTIQDRDEQASLAQALHMAVGSTYSQTISQPDGRLMKMINGGAANRQIIDEFYLASLSRFPSDLEQKELADMVQQRGSREQSLESLVWALLCSREFAYNH